MRLAVLRAERGRPRDEASRATDSPPDPHSRQLVNWQGSARYPILPFPASTACFAKSPPRPLNAASRRPSRFLQRQRRIKRCHALLIRHPIRSSSNHCLVTADGCRFHSIAHPWLIVPQRASLRSIVEENGAYRIDRLAPCPASGAETCRLAAAAARDVQEGQDERTQDHGGGAGARHLDGAGLGRELPLRPFRAERRHARARRHDDHGARSRPAWSRQGLADRQGSRRGGPSRLATRPDRLLLRRRVASRGLRPRGPARALHARPLRLEPLRRRRLRPLSRRRSGRQLRPLARGEL